MDGYEVLAALQSDAQTRDIPVVALSADAMPIEIESGLKAGFRRYLTKPVKFDELLEVLNGVKSSKLSG
jgi:CheY-like chemotaxis protein